MEQYYNILFNESYTGFTSAKTIETKVSVLKYENKYYFNPTGENSKLVDFSNVRSFLANKANEKVVKSFYSFLSSSPIMNSAIITNPLAVNFNPTAEFKEIYYDDEKLANSFNDFYDSSISRGLNSNYLSNPDVFNESIRNQLLPDEDNILTSQTVFNNYYFWESLTPISPAVSIPKHPLLNAVLDVIHGDRNESGIGTLVKIPKNNENYYINVFLTKNFSQTSRYTFDVCDNIIYKNLQIPVMFSQSPSDVSRYSEFVNNQVNFVEKKFDNSIIKTTKNIFGDFAFSSSTVSNRTIEISNHLIQCFVNPNFAVNENEYWKDN
jgi:hypothetical protein